MLQHVVWQKLNDVLDLLNDSVNVMTLMMEAVRPSETPSVSTRLHDSAPQKTAIFMWRSFSKLSLISFHVTNSSFNLCLH